MEPRSQEQVAAALDALEHGDAFLLLDRDWRLVLVNRRQEELSRRPRGETVGRLLWELWPDARDGLYWREYHRCMEARVPVAFEDYYAPLDLWTEVTAYPAANGGIAVFFRDASPRKRAEQALRRAEAELRRSEAELADAFLNSPDMLCLVGADGFLRKANPAMEAVLGRPEAELLSRPYLGLVHPDDREPARAEAARILAGERTVQFTVRLLRPDGQYRWASFNASAAPGADVFVAAGRDVTEDRRRAQFEQQLVGIVSHDLRSPLGTILLAAAALVQRAEAIDERTLGAAARIRAAADRALALIADLLDFTHARLGGGIPVAPEPLDLHATVHAVAEEVHAQYPERRIRYEAAGSGEGRWDRARLGQVVANLVTNAFKYGSPHAEVVVRTAAERDQVVIEVRNAGDPIDPAVLPRLFEPLSRAARAGGGVGLGLYIVSEIARAHGGAVEARSAPGEATTFRVRLPRVTAG